MTTGDGLAHRFDDGARVRALLDLRIRRGHVQDVWIQLNPAKLSAWTPPAPTR